MAITSRMKEIADAYHSGTSPTTLAIKYGISIDSVLKKVRKYDRAVNQQASVDPKPHKPSKNTGWDIEIVRRGMEQYLVEFGHYPTAKDFDEVTYLPSARHVQRIFGGVVQLRKQLGYQDTDFTRGELRKNIAVAGNKRGLEAEEYFEPLLIEKFGEPFVHVQKRYYKGSRNRYDFLVYAKGRVFGIDIFTTDRVSYIEKNVRHKIKRYKGAPENLDIYFVLVGREFTSEDAVRAGQRIAELSSHPNMQVVHETGFMELIDTFEALEAPEHFLGLEEIEKE